MAGHAAEEIRVVMILAAQEVLVFGQLGGQRNLVAGGAELRRLHHGFQERLLVEFRLGLHQQVVDVLQRGIAAVGEGVMHWLVDGVFGVAARAIDVGDGVAGGAGDAGLGGGVIADVEVRIIKCAAEKRHHVMAARAPARRLHVAVALQGHLPRLVHAEEIRLVVERAEVMRAVKPALVGIRVALEAVVVHHQGARGDELAGGRARERGHEVICPLDGAAFALLRVHRVHGHAAEHEHAGRRRPLCADLPADARPGQPMQHVQPDGEQRRDDVGPVNRRTQARVFD